MRRPAASRAGSSQVGGAQVWDAQDVPAQVGGAQDVPAQDGSTQVDDTLVSGDRREAALRRAVRALTYGPRRRNCLPSPGAGATKSGSRSAVPAIVITLHAILGWRWTIADLVVFAMFLCVSPSASRHAITGRARCVSHGAPYQDRLCRGVPCVATRRAAAHLLDGPGAARAERVRLWCPAGSLAADFELAADILAAACWAREIRCRR